MIAPTWYRFHSPPLLLVLLLLSSLAFSEGSVRLCGQRLTRTLMAVCRNQLCGSFAQVKRSSVWLPPSGGLRSVHYEAKRAGIATECCENRCSFNYLKTYCCNK